MTDDERAIRELVETWMAATKAGDRETLLGLIAEDMLFMVPGREPFGKAEFAGDSDSMKDLAFEGRADVLEVHVAGDWAWIRNFIEVEIALPGGAEPMRRSGYTLGILRREPDGKWRLMCDANLVA
jgi:uncharacterized protein (TIGR02246 family)